MTLDEDTRTAIASVSLGQQVLIDGLLECTQASLRVVSPPPTSSSPQTRLCSTAHGGMSLAICAIMGPAGEKRS